MNSISDSELKVLIKNNYLKFLKRIASDEEIEYHFNQIKNKTISLDELDSIFQNSQEYKDLVRHNNKIQNISKDFEEIILNIKNFDNNPLSSSDEPKSILVSCFSEVTKNGEIFILKDDSLKKLYNENACYGLFYDKKHSILFCITRTMPQIIAFKICDKNIRRLKVSFSNYIFGEDAHGCCVLDNKIYLVATEGEQNGQNAEEVIGPGKEHVGKIIVSEIIFMNDDVVIKDSKIFNLW